MKENLSPTNKEIGFSKKLRFTKIYWRRFYLRSFFNAVSIDYESM
jgi:undecaprenyl pyrophosphate synthase